ncbi:MAG: dihydropteroate synthase, partial [Micrococcales bacterium]|nr:dihydropteroate synthase [Micrococcales bacterium]
MLRVRDREFGPQARLVMGIVNRTPDSFYDGGSTFELAAACERVDAVVAQGADIVDIGGVKAGVGPEVSAQQEIERVLDVVVYTRRAHPDVLISIDTWRATVADAVCAAGADIVNDPWGGPDPLLPQVAARHGATLVVAHAGGMAPRQDPSGAAFENVVADVLGVTQALA